MDRMSFVLAMIASAALTAAFLSAIFRRPAALRPAIARAHEPDRRPVA